MQDLRDEQVLSQIIAMYEDSVNQDRIRKHEVDFDVVFGNQRRYVLTELMKKYKESYNEMPVIHLKIGNKIVRKLSRAYSGGVTRKVLAKKTKELNERLTNLINYIYSEVDETNRDFNMVMSRANEYYTNHRYVELFTYVDAESGKIKFRPLPQNLFMAISNQTKTEAEIIVFKQEIKDFTDVKAHIDWRNIPSDWEDANVDSVYTIWSKEYNFNFVRLAKEEEKIENNVSTKSVTYKIAITQNDNNPDGINPYGILPFAQIKEATEGKFYPFGTEIAEMSKELNVIFCDVATIASNQGFGQAVIYYDTDSPPAITKSGPTHVINIPNKTGNSKFEFANPNPDLKGHLDVALALTRLLLTTNDLTTDKVSGELNATNFASAIDRLIADSESIENIDDQRKKYAAVEKKQFLIMMHILNYLYSNQLWPEDYPRVTLADLNISDYELCIEYHSIKPLTTEKEKIETITMMEEKGLILPYEKHMRFSEGISKDDAIERERLIQEEKKKKAASFMGSSLMLNGKNSPDKMNQENDDNMEENEEEDKEEEKENASETIKRNKLNQNPQRRQKENRINGYPNRQR